MFSIAHFIFGLKDSLNEGGNTRALVRDPLTGRAVPYEDPETGAKKDQVRKFRGREGYAEDIDLKSGRITRPQLRADVIEMLKVLDNEFKQDHGRPLWDPAQRDDILGTGFAFNGSSAHLFTPPPTEERPNEGMTDEEFIEYKPKVGDIDLMVPKETERELFQTLNRLEDKQLTSRIAYVGHNKKSAEGIDQINALFAYTWDTQAPEGEGDTFFQIDFEFKDFEGGRPTDWAKFSHSSSWRDIQSGVKGLAHKILLFSIASVVSPSPINARLATPTATAENPKISMKTDDTYVPPSPEKIEGMVQAKIDQAIASGSRSRPDVIRKKAEAEVKSEITAASKKPARLRSMKSLDLVSGHSDRYVKLDWNYNGDEVYKYLKRAERTSATKELRQIFINLFGNNPPPDENDMKDFGSFLGVLDIMKRRLSPMQIVKTYEIMAFSFFGESAQKISATDKQTDMNVKDRALAVFRQTLPDVNSSTLDIDALKQAFYTNYKVRGEEGFKEDDSAPGEIDESRKYSLFRLF